MQTLLLYCQQIGSFPLPQEESKGSAVLWFSPLDHSLKKNSAQSKSTKDHEKISCIAGYHFSLLNPFSHRFSWLPPLHICMPNETFFGHSILLHPILALCDMKPFCRRAIGIFHPQQMALPPPLSKPQIFSLRASGPTHTSWELPPNILLPPKLCTVRCTKLQSPEIESPRTTPISSRMSSILFPP